MVRLNARQYKILNSGGESVCSTENPIHEGTAEYVGQIKFKLTSCIGLAAKGSTRRQAGTLIYKQQSGFPICGS